MGANGFSVQFVLCIMSMCTDAQLYSIRQKFFVDRVINVWNALPTTVNLTSLIFFGIALKTLISVVFFVCNILLVR